MRITFPDFFLKTGSIKVITHFMVMQINKNDK